MNGTGLLRPMRVADAEAVAVLNGQLGYPSRVDEVSARIAALVDRSNDLALVAEAGGEVVGWVHAELKPSLLEVPSVQVMGLVVGEGQRNGGIGLRLLEAAEAWAVAHGVQRMVVGSRVTRERAHRFYLREGYSLLKTSYYFEKSIPAAVAASRGQGA